MGEQGKTLCRWLLGIALGLGVVFLYVGQRSAKMRELGSDTPKEITCAELAAKGPGDNIHVTVKDLQFGQCYVARQKNGVWQDLWIPIFPIVPPSQEVRIVVKSFKVKNEGDLEGLVRRQTLTGVITNDVFSPGSKELTRLSQDYPQLNPDKVLILEVDRTFPDEAQVQNELLGGGITAGVALLISLIWFFRTRNVESAPYFGGGPAPLDAPEAPKTA